MSTVELNWERDIAKDFILNTNRNIFLTGKAGTGKTTLLKEILEETDKNFIVTAPTGVAAINAGGQTLHSLFLFPLKSYIPLRDQHHSVDRYYDSYELAKHQKFSREKLDLFITLEILIIDEISMVRADLMDAIDQSLRRVRKNPRPFGGVQLLVIGDLFQLSPVVKEQDRYVLANYYDGFYFFNSKVWQEANPVSVELKKVYRQKEESFIAILNKIRVGERDEQAIAYLNEKYKDSPDFKDTITLTTHNKKADAINQSELDKIDSKEISLDAQVSGRFPESAYPASDKIILKVGARVMFIRNHSEELYFNGKTGTILKVGEDTVTVKPDDGHKIIVEPVEWKNVKYAVDPEQGKIVQEELGAFTQYPLRLAWAVTVHKSQGLTFDKLILDLESTFASGQLYVALSRCRSLAGLTLLSKISASNIICDQRVVAFTAQNQIGEEIEEILETEKFNYDFYKIKNHFDLEFFDGFIDLWETFLKENEVPGKANCVLLINNLKAALKKLVAVSNTFKSHLDVAYFTEDRSHAHLADRILKAITYFTDEIYEKLILPIINHTSEYIQKSKVSKYLKLINHLEDSLWAKLNQLYNITYLDAKLYPSSPKHVQDEKVNVKGRVKGQTFETTYELFKKGQSISGIAKIRNLTEGSIESHISKLIKDERISVFEIMTKERVEQVGASIKDHSDKNFTELRILLPFDVTYGELRFVRSHLGLSK